MLYVVFADGRVDELPEATQAVGQDGVLVCNDPRGKEIRVYDRLAVLMFGHDDRIKRIAENIRAER
jgi:hypothetical protein